MVHVGKAPRFQFFANASQTKYWKSAMHRGRIDKLPKWKASPAWQASGAMEMVGFVRKVAVDAQIPGRDLPDTDCEVERGSRRLMSPQNASLMVIASADRLHACGPSGWEHLCDLIYIIGLGLPAVLASTWRSARGRPANLVNGKGIFLHAPAATRKKCTFLLSSSLVDEHPDLNVALQHCAQLPQSKWKIKKDRGQPLAANFCRVGTISQLAAAILKLRTLAADGSRGYGLSPA
jgi:hypothetical protein